MTVKVGLVAALLLCACAPDRAPASTSAPARRPDAAVRTEAPARVPPSLQECMAMLLNIMVVDYRDHHDGQWPPASVRGVYERSVVEQEDALQRCLDRTPRVTVLCSSIAPSVAVLEACAATKWK